MAGRGGILVAGRELDETGRGGAATWDGRVVERLERGIFSFCLGNKKKRKKEKEKKKEKSKAKRNRENICGCHYGDHYGICTARTIILYYDGTTRLISRYSKY